MWGRSVAFCQNGGHLIVSGPKTSVRNEPVFSISIFPNDFLATLLTKTKLNRLDLALCWHPAPRRAVQVGYGQNMNWYITTKSLVGVELYHERWPFRSLVSALSNFVGVDVEASAPPPYLLNFAHTNPIHSSRAPPSQIDRVPCIM